MDVWPTYLQVNPWPVMFQYCIHTVDRRKIQKPDRRGWMSDLPAGEFLTSHVPVMYRQKGDPKTWQKSMDVWPIPASESLTSHVPVLYRQKGDPKTWQKGMDVWPTPYLQVSPWPVMFQLDGREIPTPERRVSRSAGSRSCKNLHLATSRF
jgi:hypothetical protein